MYFSAASFEKHGINRALPCSKEYTFYMKPTALITGASGGLGLEFAKLCARDGYDLVLAARSENRLNDIKSQLEKTYHICVYVFPVDLSKKDAALDVYRFTKENQLNIGILINNAGFGLAGSFKDTDWQKQYEMVQLNITALMQLTHCYLKDMTAKGSGKILNLSSVAAYCAGPDMSVYYASKAFVKSFSEALSTETKGTGVTVTALCPGPTATGFEKAAAEGQLNMFRHAADPASVAKAGYEAMKQGRAVCNPGILPKLMNFGSRIAPDVIAKKIAFKMNH